MSDYTVRKIFKSLCYDEEEDDPWIYLTCLSQDTLPSEMLPLRLKCDKHILGMTEAQLVFPCEFQPVLFALRHNQRQVGGAGDRSHGEEEVGLSRVCSEGSKPARTKHSEDAEQQL